jgi:hypothetical protein
MWLVKWNFMQCDCVEYTQMPRLLMISSSCTYVGCNVCTHDVIVVHGAQLLFVQLRHGLNHVLD